VERKLDSQKWFVQEDFLPPFEHVLPSTESHGAEAR
jgi:hypothetical protein